MTNNTPNQSGIEAVAAVFQNTETITMDAMPDQNDDLSPPPYEAGDGGYLPPAPPMSPDEPQDPHLEYCASQPETDLGNARRFLRRYGEDVIYVLGEGLYHYNGKKWEISDPESGKVRLFAAKAAEAIKAEYSLITPSEHQREILQRASEAEKELSEISDLSNEQKSQLKNEVSAGKDINAVLKKAITARKSHWKSSCNSAKLSNMIGEAKPYINIDPSDLDKDPLLLNCANGTIRFEKISEVDDFTNWQAKLYPHHKGDYLTKCIEADYDIEARSEIFEKFLLQLIPSEEDRAYLQRLIGYAATGYIREQNVIFFHGIGNNGKSTFLEVIRYILSGYAATGDVELITGDDKRSTQNASADLMHLKGARFVTTSEPEGGVKLKESLIKKWTGGMPILARGIHEKYMVEFIPKFTIFMDCNHKPKITNDDDGIWRRIVLFQWPVQVSPNKVDKSLLDKLKSPDEMKGILNWIVQGVEEYLVYGLKTPDHVIADVNEYREESDIYGGFIRTCCVVTGDENDVALPKDLHTAFEKYMEETVLTPHTFSTFSRRMSEQVRRSWESPDGTKKQFVKKKSSKMVYRGIYIKDEYKPSQPSNGWNYDE